MQEALLMVDNSDRTENQSQLDVIMKHGRPSVYNLPHNPINNKGFKYSYMQSRMEAKRRDIVSAQT